MSSNLNNILTSFFLFLFHTGSRNGVRYSIYSGDPDGYFSIDLSTGNIRVANTLDHETKQQILLNIQAISSDPPMYGHTQVIIWWKPLFFFGIKKDASMWIVLNNTKRQIFHLIDCIVNVAIFFVCFFILYSTWMKLKQQQMMETNSKRMKRNRCKNYSRRLRMK